MLLISHNAERELVTMLGAGKSRPQYSAALHLRFAGMDHRPGMDMILQSVQSAVRERNSALYECRDGDVIIAWAGGSPLIAEDIVDSLVRQLPDMRNANGQRFFDLGKDAAILLATCEKKLADLKRREEKKPLPLMPSVSATSGAPPLLTPEQIIVFRAASLLRKNRERPRLLIVEDQEFFTRLLLEVLEWKYKTDTASNAADALTLYCAHAPDVIFVDIDLPGMDGHQLTQLMRELDPQAYIVMVTGNTHPDDVARAKKNGTKAFIAKPYSRAQIHKTLERFMEIRPAYK